MLGFWRSSNQESHFQLTDGDGMLGFGRSSTEESHFQSSCPLVCVSVLIMTEVLGSLSRCLL